MILSNAKIKLRAFSLIFQFFKFFILKIEKLLILYVRNFVSLMKHIVLYF